MKHTPGSTEIARRKRLIFRPFHWVVLPLIAAALWIGFLRVLLIIPTPADLDYERTYFSPLPATAFMYFFHLNAPLLGWQASFPAEKYTMSFSNARNFTVPDGGCANFSVLDLKLAPGSLWGTFVRWEVREIGICGEPD